MAKTLLHSILLLLAIVAAVNAVVVGIFIGRRRREAHLQSLPLGCKMQFDVEKRDGSNQVDFVVCVKDGKVCTSRSVKRCSGSKTKCEGFKPQYVENLFEKLYPDAYANVCEESDGELCLYTDVVVRACGSAEAQHDDDEICITLENGEEECAHIPREMLSMVQNFDSRDRNQDAMSMIEEQLMEYLFNKKK